MTPMRRRRPFSLLDSLVLLAATACGFAVTRSLAGLQTIDRMESVDYLVRGSEDPPGKRTSFKSQYYGRGAINRPTSGQSLAYWIQRVTFWPCPCLAAWTLAVLPLTSCTSRMPRRQILRRPGMMAALAWIMGFSAAAVTSPGALAAWTSPGGALTLYWQDWWFLTWFDLPRAAGYAVALSWITLALSGRFKADSGWQDRLGMLLGSCWIGLGFLSLLGSWMSEF
jgi:hypothetical protein